VERARWLGELAEALDDARRVVKQLGADEGDVATVELYARIEAVRVEIQMIRLRRSCGLGEEFGPEWTEDIPWKRSA